MFYQKMIAATLVFMMTLPTQSLASDKHILFVGNSLTYFNDMPSRLIAMLNSESDDQYHADALLRGGAKLDDFEHEGFFNRFISGRTYDSFLSRQKYDFVILQEQSTTLLYTNERPRSEAAFQALISKAHENGARVLIVNTWARKAGDPIYRARYSNLVNPRTPERMTTILYKLYKSIALQNNASLVSVGNYWGIILQQNPDVKLYPEEDTNHPNMNGSYLYATLLYCAIAGALPDEVQSSAWPVAPEFVAIVNNTVSSSCTPKARQALYDSDPDKEEHIVARLH